ncbi:unnamed protein product [Polarella glacialis]|uniref:peptidylprolyl isomerase n=1 Tax=Polarella glacialis TaxID=89957 RepID=A0A813DUA8_POLGL|nr:unnamed protein product [Polarella glacialis]
MLTPARSPSFVTQAGALPTSVSRTLVTTAGVLDTRHLLTRRPSTVPLRSSWAAAVAAGLGALAGSRRQLRRSRCGDRWPSARAAAIDAASSPSRILEKRVIRQAPRKLVDEIPKEGDLVRIHYIGRLEDSTIFDNSRARGNPFEFHLGEGEVIDGWDMLIGTMSLGERAELVIPPEYAYGEDGSPPIIPPGATLFFDVELLDIGRPMDDADDKEGSAAPVVGVEAEEEVEELFWDKDAQREGGLGQGYVWEASGTGNEILVRVPVSEDTKVKQIDVDVRTFSLRCSIGGKLVLDGEPFANVQMDDSHWDFERKGKNVYLLITMAKLDKKLRWESLLKGSAVAEAAAAAKPSKKADTQDAEVLDVDDALRMANAGRR